MSLRGVFCPVVTPFRDGKIATDAFQRNIEFWNTTGLAGYVILGSTGEAVLLAQDERVRLIELARSCAPDRPLIVGTGHEGTGATITFTKSAADLGADYALVITPSYFKGQMAPDCLRQHFLSVAEQSPVPVIIYNVPKFTGLDLTVGVIRELAGHPNICGIKESTNDLAKLMRLSDLMSSDFELLIGNAGLLLAGLAAGIDGAILALSNFAAAECVSLHNSVRQQSYDAAQRYFMRLLPLATTIVGRYGVPGIKAAMTLLGRYGGDPRPPLQPVTENEISVIEELLREAELL